MSACNLLRSVSDISTRSYESISQHICKFKTRAVFRSSLAYVNIPEICNENVSLMMIVVRVRQVVKPWPAVFVLLCITPPPPQCQSKVSPQLTCHHSTTVSNKYISITVIHLSCQGRVVHSGVRLSVGSSSILKLLKSLVWQTGFPCRACQCSHVLQLLMERQSSHSSVRQVPVTSCPLFPGKPALGFYPE